MQDPAADATPVTVPETPKALESAAATPATAVPEEPKATEPETSTGTTVGLMHAKPWVMTREKLVELNACKPGVDLFDERTRSLGTPGVWTLRDGWTDAETRALAREAPTSLRWYARHKLIPVTRAEALEAIDAVQGSHRSFLSLSFANARRHREQSRVVKERARAERAAAEPKERGPRRGRRS